MSTAVSTDTLPNIVPVLDKMGLNWVIFKLRFREAVAAKKKWGHFDGSKPRPVTANPPTEAEVAAVTTWDEDEDISGDDVENRKGLLNDEGAWCWRDDCEGVLLLSIPC